MAHNIEFNEQIGTYSFVEAGKRDLAWHGLGKQFFEKDALTIEEALKFSNADYIVMKTDIVALSSEIKSLMEQGLDIPCDLLRTQIFGMDKQAIIRIDNNKPLGIVGKQYGIVNNFEAFQFLNDLCCGGNDKTPFIECCGVLGKGERIFVTAKFPTPIRTTYKGVGDIDKYIVFTTSHDGSGAVKCMVTPIRVVCNNTLNMALGKSGHSGMISFKHRSNVQSHLANMAKANEVLGFAEVYENEFKAELENLGRINLSDKQIDEAIASLILNAKDMEIARAENFKMLSEDLSSQSKNTFNLIKETCYSGVGQKNLDVNNGLWLYNGITCFTNNVKPKSVTDKTTKIKSVDEEAQFNSLFNENGTAMKWQNHIKEKVYELAI